MPAIGPYPLANPVVLAPMAGVTDLPFRRLCRRLGAGLVVGEMVSGNADLRNTCKSRQRLDHTGEPEPIAVQIVGGDPDVLAEAARLITHQRRAGGFITDFFGRASHIDAAVDVPVTLKMRTGWSPDMRNAVRIAQMAEDAGIVSLAVHGRTRACGYQPTVEYHTIRDVKAAVNIPVFANGDIDSPQKAAEVMAFTGADGVLIGRAAQGRPWIFRQIAHYLATGEELPEPAADDVRDILVSHLHALYDFYGEYLGVRIARKHVSWYLQSQPSDGFRKVFNQLGCPDTQIKTVLEYFSDSANKKDKVA